MPHLSRILAALCLTAALTACGAHEQPVVVTTAAASTRSHPWVDAPEQTSAVAVDAPEERAFATRPSRSEPTTTTTPQAPVSAPPAARVAPPPQPRVDAAAAPPPAAQPSGWAALRQCESGGDYSDDTGNGYYGAYQFDQGTWNSTAVRLGRDDLVGVNPALELFRERGRQPWPICGRYL